MWVLMAGLDQLLWLGVGGLGCRWKEVLQIHHTPAPGYSPHTSASQGRGSLHPSSLASSAYVEGMQGPPVGLLLAGPEPLASTGSQALSTGQPNWGGAALKVPEASMTAVGLDTPAWFSAHSRAH